MPARDRNANSISPSGVGLKTGRTADYPDADATVEVLETGWELYRARERMEESPVVAAARFADRGILSLFAGEMTPTLFIQCRRNRTKLSIAVGQYLSTRDLTVEWRVDRDKSLSWAISSDQQSLLAPAPVPLARRLGRGKRLVVEVTPYAQRPVRVTFT